MLAHMLHTDRSALICDMAETYNIYNFVVYKPSYIATLACGLGDNSRIKKKLNGVRASTTDMLLSLLLDGINTLIWLQTEDARIGTNRPKSVYKSIMGIEESTEYESVNIEDFEAEWLKRGGGKHV